MGVKISSLTLREEHRLKRYNVREGGLKMHNEELHNLLLSPSIIRMIKSRRMRLARHAA
jgi:hypothetical protein